MNRQIKFRGKRIDNGEWVYGNLVEKTRWDLHKDYFVTWNKLTKNPNDLLTDSEYIEEQVDPDTVGQFTGLCDKSGKEIYEGDIIQGEYKHKHLIRYSNDEACFTATLVEYVGNIVAEKWNTGRVYQDWINEFEKVVIGNIYDNNELMEGGNNESGN